MKIKTIALTVLLITWAAPSFAITAQATYQKFANFEALINSPNVTKAALEKALEQAATATAAYTETSAANTPLAQKDEKVGAFQTTLLSLAFSMTKASFGNLQEARSDVRYMMNNLRQHMR